MGLCNLKILLKTCDRIKFSNIMNNDFYFITEARTVMYAIDLRYAQILNYCVYN